MGSFGVFFFLYVVLHVFVSVGLLGVSLVVFGNVTLMNQDLCLLVA